MYWIAALVIFIFVMVFVVCLCSSAKRADLALENIMARWDSEEDIDEKESAGATRAKSENVAEIDNFIAPRVNRPARRRSA